MKFSFKSLWQVIKCSGQDFLDFRITRMSAALAYYTIFAIAPMIILIINVSTIFYKKEATLQNSIYGEIRSFVGDAAALQIQDLIKTATLSNGSTFASVVSIIAIVVAATGIFSEIQDSINIIWGLKAKPTNGVLKFLLNRLLSFSVIVSVSFVLLVSLLINSVLDILFTRLERIFPHLKVAYVGNLILTFIITTYLFGAIFKILPDAKIKWKDVLKGAITTSLLFMLGKFGITFYLGTKNIGNIYGAAGSIIIVLLWVYYSSIILYFGAAVTKNNAQLHGNRIYPNDYAVWTEYVEKEHKGALPQQDSAVTT